MAQHTRTISSVLTAVLTVIIFFIFVGGCSENIDSPLAPDTPPGFLETSLERGTDSPNSLFGGYKKARDPKILHTREGESLSAQDVRLIFDPDAVPANFDPRVEVPIPTFFIFDLEPTGTILDRPIEVTIDYSKADLKGVNEENLQVYGVVDDGLIPVLTVVNVAEATVSFLITSFSRYALARD